MAKKKLVAETKAALKVFTVPDAVPGPLNPDSPVTWRGLTAELFAQYDTAWGGNARLTEKNLNECAALVELTARDICEQFAKMSRKCDDSETETVKAAIAITLDRSGPATKCEAHIKGSDKWVNIKKETDVADPDQELALFAEGKQAEEAGAETPPEEAA